MPVLILVELLGFHVETRSKVLCLIHSSTVLILLLIVSHFIRFNVGTSAVVATIAYTNSRCIYFALIIIYIRNMIARKSLWKVFKCFDNIDLRLQTTFDIKIKCDDSKWRIRVTLLVLFASAFASLAFECYNERAFNVGQLVHAMLVFILSVKILYYCMFCASIKLRFKALIKYLRDIKSSQTMFAAKTKATKYVAAKSIGNVSQLKEISLIYDELLEIILLLNESFSWLLSFAFGEWCGGDSDEILVWFRGGKGGVETKANSRKEERRNICSKFSTIQNEIEDSRQRNFHDF